MSASSLPSEIRQTRRQLASLAGLQYGGDRDLYEVLGYERTISPQQYRDRYERQDIARNVVEAKPTTSWREAPTITDKQEDETSGEGPGPDSAPETDFETDIAVLFERLRLLHYLKRADILSGIGEFGILLLGLTDDNDLNEEPDQSSLSGDPADDIAYIATFGQTSVTPDMVTDPNNPRYGLPQEYDIVFDGSSGSNDKVHWQRVIHLAENRLDNEVYGRPRQKTVWNRLDDLSKVVGASAEMYWRGADRKFVANSTGEQLVDEEKMKTQVENLVHDLDSVAYLRNVELEPIAGDSVDPSGIANVLLQLIAGTTGIPKRMLIGSEQAELASTQDRATYYGRIEERRRQHCAPTILRPLIDRLIELGIVATPKEDIPNGVGYAAERGGRYRIEWPTLFELTEVEEAEVQKMRAESVKTAAPMGDTSQLATVEELRSQVLGWSELRGSEAVENESEEVQIPDVPEPPTNSPPTADSPSPNEGQTPVADGGTDDENE